MKKWILILMGVALCSPISAQESHKVLRSKIVPIDSVAANEPRFEAIGMQPAIQADIATDAMLRGDSLHLPELNSLGQVMPLGRMPYYWGGHSTWDLHQGLNVSLGASVFASFGKHSYRGAGFSQNISLSYAMPLSDRISLAIGGYFNHVSWAHHSYRDAGLTAVLGYRFNEHWEAYVYGQKSLSASRRMPYPLYDMTASGDRLGAAIRYNVNPNFSFQVLVEGNWMPRDRMGYFDQYNYPVPLP